MMGALARVKPSERLQIAILILSPSLVAQILAPQELREVSSWWIAFHAMGPPMLENSAKYASELEQWNCYTMGDGISNLRAPEYVTVGGKMVFPIFLGRNIISKGFGIQHIRMMEINVDGFLGTG